MGFGVGSSVDKIFKVVRCGVSVGVSESIGWGVFRGVGAEYDRGICDEVGSDVGDYVEIGYGWKVNFDVDSEVWS